MSVWLRRPSKYSSTAAVWAERNRFKANQKSCSMASPDSSHTWEFARTAARATLCLACHYMTAASGVPQENQASITDLRPGLFECHLHLWTRCLLWTNCDLSREHNREQAVPPSHAPPSLTVHAHVNISSTTEIPGGALRHTKKTRYSEMSLSK